MPRAEQLFADFEALDPAAIAAAAGRLAAVPLYAGGRGKPDVTLQAALRRALEAVGVKAEQADMELIVRVAVGHYLTALHDPGIRPGGNQPKPEDCLTAEVFPSDFGQGMNISIPYRGYRISIYSDDSLGFFEGRMIRSDARIFNATGADLTDRFLTRDEQSEWVDGSMLETIMARIAKAEGEHRG